MPSIGGCFLWLIGLLISYGLLIGYLSYTNNLLITY